MQYRTLRGTTLSASVVAFGCGSVLGRVGGRAASRAIQTALDQGINYFDLARAYGFGEAEGFVGKLLRGKRDKVLLASKFGTVPLPRSRARNFMKPLVRSTVKVARSLIPGAYDAMRRKAYSLTTRGHFDAGTAQQSLERSLQELRTDYLDVFLLHDCTAEAAHDDELFRFLDRVTAEGKVRYYGIASTEAVAPDFVRDRPSVRVVQLANNAVDDSIRRVRGQVGAALIGHSPFGRGGPMEALRQFIAKNPADGKRWSEMSGINLDSVTGVGRFFLEFAIASNHDGIVVCGMYDAKHIQENAAVASHASSGDAVPNAAQEMREMGAFHLVG